MWRIKIILEIVGHANSSLNPYVDSAGEGYNRNIYINIQTVTLEILKMTKIKTLIFLGHLKTIFRYTYLCIVYILCMAVNN